MRFTGTIVCGLIALVGCARFAVAAVPIDRPSPPPYCADGKCYPKTETWGVYQGRWRSWPGVDERPGQHAPTPTPAQLLGPDLKPYETPLPQDEDRRAPPPTQPREAPMGPMPTPPPAGAAPEPTPPQGPGMAPAGPSAGPPAEPRVMMPIPGGRSLPGPGGDDGDYPPDVPFRSTPPSPAERAPLPFGSPTPNALPSNVPGDLPIPPDRAQLQRDPLHRSASDDPPPPLPVALGGLASR